MLNHRGFSLVELAVVLLAVAILSVFVAQRLSNVTGMKAGAFVKKLRADIRYAQNVAMIGNRRTRVYFNGTGTAPAAGYAVVVDGSASGDCSAFIAVSDPAGTGNLAVTLAAGDYTGITVAPTTTCLEYDSLGSPYNCGGGLGVCAAPASAGGMTITVPAAAAAVNTVTVTAGTGAVNN